MVSMCCDMSHLVMKLQFLALEMLWLFGLLIMPVELLLVQKITQIEKFYSIEDQKECRLNTFKQPRTKQQLSCFYL